MKWHDRIGLIIVTNLVLLGMFAGLAQAKWRPSLVDIFWFLWR